PGIDRVVRNPEAPVQPVNRDEPSAQVEDLALAVNGGNIFSGGAQRTLDRRARQNETVFTDADDESVDDRHGEGQFDEEGGASAHFGGDLDFSAQLLDVALHDIHADAAAGNGGDLLRGGKAGGENERERFLSAEFFAGRDDPFFDGLVVDFGRIDAAAV